jgi:hypothetical protein
MPGSTVPGLEKYEQRIADRLVEIDSTPTGRIVVAWVRLHKPKITLGQPITGGGFTYPWPLDSIVISPEWDDNWLRGAIVHELQHVMKYGGPGTLFGSLEQERDACWLSSRVWAEYPPNDPIPAIDRPDYFEKAGWVLDQSPEAARRVIRDTWGGFYKSLPELQPGRWPWQQLAAGWPQIIFGLRVLFHRE